MIDQPLRLALDPALEALDEDELRRRYVDEARAMDEQDEDEDEDEVEREVRRRMRELHRPLAGPFVHK